MIQPLISSLEFFFAFFYVAAILEFETNKLLEDWTLINKSSRYVIMLHFKDDDECDDLDYNK